MRRAELPVASHILGTSSCVPGSDKPIAVYAQSVSPRYLQEMKFEIVSQFEQIWAFHGEWIQFQIAVLHILSIELNCGKLQLLSVLHYGVNRNHCGVDVISLAGGQVLK